MVFDEELLIDLIRAHRYLYDPADIHYHNSVVKDSSWEEISRTLQHPAIECKKKWTSLRDCYRKAMRHRKTKIDQKSSSYKPWKLEENMAFLIPFIGDREQKSRATSDDVMSDVEDDGADNSTSCEPDVTIGDNIGIGWKSTPMATSSVCTSSAGYQPSSPVANVLRSYFEQKQASKMLERKRDYMKKFFDAMEETVRTFQPHLQIEIKGKISALVTEYELKNLIEQHPPMQSPYYACESLKQE